MYPEEIEKPVPIGHGNFVDQEEGGSARVTLAAYLLLAGPLFIEGVAGAEEHLVLPPTDELETMGVNSDVRERFARHGFDMAAMLSEAEERPSAQALAELAEICNAERSPQLAARLVALGTRSEDELIRVCALGSAVEFFDLAAVDWPGQISWFFEKSRQTQTFTLLATLLARIGSPAVNAFMPAPPSQPRQAPTGGLLAIHGKVLPLGQSNRPEWSVPPNGSLFQHIQGFRPDIYGNPDYFRWEGGYTDYAREVAIANLFDWVDRRKLFGVDVVTHSHGCNVAMGSMRSGIIYRKMVLLSCPVHWNKYSIPKKDITSQFVSVRIKVDLVILMDRGGQRFPTGTLYEDILPLWYTAHDATTKPKTWLSRRLDQYLL